MSRYRVSSFNIFPADEPEEKLEILVEKPVVVHRQAGSSTKRHTSVKRSLKKNNPKIKPPPNWLRSDDEDDEDDIMEEAPIMRRVERFLSIVDLPQDVIYATQQVFAQRHSIIAEEDENEEEEGETAQVANKAVAVKGANKSRNVESFQKSNKFSYFQEGYGLSQDQKAKIISDIIKNFNMERYLEEFRERDTALIKLKKK